MANKKGIQWHIVLISIFLLIFSFFSWFGIIWKVSSVLTQNFQPSNFGHSEAADEKIVEHYSDRKKKNGKSNRMSESLAVIDGMVEQIDAKWYGNMSKKSSLSILDSFITYHVTGEISSSQVALGSEKWLFYKTTTDGDPISDFEGTNLYSKEEKDAFLNAASRVQEKLKNKGIKFSLFVAPNKENVYAEYMPDIYSHAEISSTDMLIEHLSDGGIHVVDPKRELLLNHDKYQLYYSYDSHWNQLGGYIGVKKILDSWDIQIPGLNECTIAKKSLADCYHESGNDDLARMLGLLSVFNDDIEYEVGGTLAMDWSAFSSEQKKKQVSHFINHDAIIKDSVLLVGDSFRLAMIPVLRMVYKDVYVLHRSYYTSDVLEKVNPSYVIAEYVERYSRQIGNIDMLVK